MPLTVSDLFILLKRQMIIIISLINDFLVCSQLFGDVFGGYNTMSESLKQTTDRLLQESVNPQQHEQQVV